MKRNKAEIEGEASRFKTLHDVVQGLDRVRRNQAIVDVVVQDEYSHDIVVQWDDGVYVVYGTT
jgi:hypothetical protein